MSLCEIFVSGDHVLGVENMHTISKYSCLWLFVDLHEGFFKDLSRQQSGRVNIHVLRVNLTW